MFAISSTNCQRIFIKLNLLNLREIAQVKDEKNPENSGIHEEIWIFAPYCYGFQWKIVWVLFVNFRLNVFDTYLEVR